MESEKPTAPESTQPRGRVIGLGGVFFKSPNAPQAKAWYAKHLGFEDKGYGVMLHWREKDNPDKEQMTIWSVFPSTSDYFGPGNAQMMLNYIVDDMDAFLTRMEAEGVKIDPKRQDESYGRFAWIYDSDDNKIELWQPL